MRRVFKKFLTLLGPSILGALGFTSCDFPLIPRTEYGTPNCDFKVDITVQDEAGNPLKGIKVSPVLISTYNKLNYTGTSLTSSTAEHREELASIETDASGKASGSYNLFGVTKDIRVIFEDADGNLNGGTFAKDSMDFTPVQTGKGDNHWYSGEYTISGTKKLKKE